MLDMGVVQAGHCSEKARASHKHQWLPSTGTGVGVWKSAQEIESEGQEVAFIYCGTT